ncbi:MAG: ATP synthase subunit I, partial [Roseovarius sp.]
HRQGLCPGEGVMGWSAFFSALLGGLIAILGQIVVHWVKERPKKKLDDKRKETLKFMLKKENMPKDTEWRKIETLERVIGASREETKRLLVEIEARGNEKQDDVWALIKDKPLPIKLGEK